MQSNRSGINTWVSQLPILTLTRNTLIRDRVLTNTSLNIHPNRGSMAGRRTLVSFWREANKGIMLLSDTECLSEPFQRNGSEWLAHILSISWNLSKFRAKHRRPSPPWKQFFPWKFKKHSARIQLSSLGLWIFAIQASGSHSLKREALQENREPLESSSKSRQSRWQPTRYETVDAEGVFLHAHD